MSQVSIPKYIREGLEKQNAKTLRAIARMADELADDRESEAEAELEEDEVDEHDLDEDELDPEEAPASATVTTKEIKGNSYYYWQWREGDKVKSEYIRPVDPKE